MSSFYKNSNFMLTKQKLCMISSALVDRVLRLTIPDVLLVTDAGEMSGIFNPSTRPISPEYKNFLLLPLLLSFLLPF